ncbi:hypothetical protein WA026_012082 [Henosepilachna vigintioctopunctata]|uniref:DUF4789 domain-containing protein n=1 Tax=Henosepilachna vigintioctopunctata TaxID=420089 RepID=A0AAW1V648_9CUCU
MGSLLALWLLLVIEQIWCQDIHFPSEYDNYYNNPKIVPEIPPEQPFTTEPPKPVRNPEKCPGNQLLYPGREWFCDCGPTFIFYPPKNDCFRAYMRGPCTEGQHLVVKNKRVTCVKNPCQENYVRYNGRCYELGNSEGPCDKINGTTAFLQIDPDTLEVKCTKSSAGVLTLFNFPDRCPPGSKRDSKNKCRENWNV